MKKVIVFFFATVAFNPALAAQVARPPVPPAKPVTETLFGQKVTDRYRYFEQQGPAVTDWMKAEGRYTRSVLDALPRHDEILAKLSAMTGSMDVVTSITRSGGRTFYEQRSAGSDNYDLMVRDPDGRVRKIVDVAAIRAANGGDPFAINYFTPSNDGTRVAVGISEGGSEDASLWVYDAATGARIAGPVPNAQFGIVNWQPDDRGLFVNLLTPLKPGAPETDKYKFAKDYLWDFKSPPVPVLGTGISPAVPFKPEEFPAIVTVPGAPIALALNVNGVQNEIAVWTAPVAEAGRPDTPWKALVARDDDVTNIAVAGSRIFLMSHKDAPTFKVLALNAGEPISAAREVIAARPDRLIEGIAAAADGLYVRARRGVYSQLIRIPLDGGPEQIVELPFKGSIDELSADPRYPGVNLILDSWAVPPRLWPMIRRRDFRTWAWARRPIGFDPSLYEALDLKAKAADGVEVPLSFVTARDAKHPRPVMLMAYGSYGISEFPAFGTRPMVTLPNGIDYAVCHVRGGGELGEAWRLGGKDANKPNTWRDLIACGEQLIAARLHDQGQAVHHRRLGRRHHHGPRDGGTAGPVRRCLRHGSRGQHDPLRIQPERTAQHPGVRDHQGREGIQESLAMDSVQHVKPGVKYPPMMITTGLNDPRVSSWEPAKLAASLHAAGDPNPVLLRIDEKAGHGIGSTKTQTDQLYADVATFILWQSGDGAAARSGGERGRK